MVIPRRLTRALALGTGAAIVVGGLVGCSADRSVEAYCQAVAQHKARYLAAMGTMSNEVGLRALLDSGAAVADLKSMWDDLAAVAPDDIEADTDSLRDQWDKIVDLVNKRQWYAAILVSLEHPRPLDRVNTYIAKHCGVNAAPVVAGAAQTDASGASAPAAPRRHRRPHRPRTRRSPRWTCRVWTTRTGSTARAAF